MRQEDKKLLEVFCEEARTKKFASYSDEQTALCMYQRAVNILMGAVDKHQDTLVARIRAYREQHGREIWIRAAS